MKLLFDEDLGPRLAEVLASEYPDSVHVRHVGLLGAADAMVWRHARGEGFAIVSKDSDFRDRSFVEGAPPRIIWLDVGNAGTDAIAGLLRSEVARVAAFASQSEASLLILSLESPSV
jgi:predicted nuclease of predicted toxin-antitoxin system